MSAFPYIFFLLAMSSGAFTDGTNYVDTLHMDTSYSETGNEAQGVMYWDDTEHTISVVMGDGVIGQIFREQYATIRNNTGSQIDNGTVVAYSGAIGASGILTGAPGIADGSIPAVYNIGIATQDIPHDSDGNVTVYGKVRGINTTGTPYGESWSAGDVVYVSAATAGALTNIAPAAPNPIVTIGAVITVHSQQGVLAVRPTYRSDLEGLSDVYGSPDTSGQVPVWDQNNLYFYFPGTFLHTSSSTKIGDISGGNYCEIEDDGTIVLHGDATGHDDLRIPLTQTAQGAMGKPDYDYTNLGLLFPQNDATEIAYSVTQMSHRKLLDSDIEPHIHYIQSSSDEPVFKMDYRWYNNGEAVPGSWTTISTADGDQAKFTYTSGSILQIAEFPSISPPTNEGPSSNVDIRLYRDDNVVSGDVLGKYVDFHFQTDKPAGSRDEYE